MPPDFTAKFNLVGQHLSQGRYEQARQILQRVLQQAPGHPDANNGMAIVLLNLGQLEPALYYCKRAVELSPLDTNNLNTYASLLIRLNREAEAIEPLRRIIKAEPQFDAARSNLANALWAAGKCSESVREMLALLKDRPDNPDVAFQTVSKLTILSRVEDAISLARERIDKGLANAELLSAYAAAILNDPSASPDDVRRAHDSYARAVEAKVQIAPHEFANSREPERRLRVGFVSPDFRGHSVSFFVEPLLASLPKELFRTICYSCSPQADETTARLKSLADEWHTIARTNDEEALAKIRGDAIDIMIDLAGLTVGHRLPLLSRRVAPVQATYCGYPATTSLSAMDYRFVDSNTDPAGSERQCRETLIRLDPCFLCYRPPAGAPDVSPPPLLASGKPTFGSFNNTSKLNRRVIELWASLLKEVPGSSLVLKAMSLRDDELRGAILERFESLGVEKGRVRCLPGTKTPQEHLQTYSQMDIALDPFPYNGTTTTIEAAYMGVPTLTLEGRMHAGRVGVTIARNLRVPEWIAKSEDEFVARAIELSRDGARLSAWRESLRRDLLASALCDAPAFASRFGAALRKVWRTWCAGK